MADSTTEFGLAEIVGVVELPELKVAVTFLAALIETMHEPVPVQASLHPANVEPEAATGVRVTELLVEKLAEQVEPQLIPVGEEVTVPLPEPTLVTTSEELPVGAADTELEAGLFP